MPQFFADPAEVADAIVAQVGRKIVLGLPLGIGKANHVANALYARAVRDPSLHLSIFTALTLEKPRGASDLERRFLEPVVERLFGAYPELEYARAMRRGTLPPNVEVNEFFFLAGRWLNVPLAQRRYISANYTHAFRYLLERGVNVVAQLVARRGERFSLSGNTDLTLDLLAARKRGADNFLLVGQVNSELPFMPGEGDLGGEAFSHVLESPATDFPLFAPPKEPVDDAEYACGLHVARLVPDGGSLQIGIGQEGDATVRSLILRHRENAAFREVTARLGGEGGHLAPFDKGLYGVSEMVVDGFLALLDEGILKREVDGVLLHGGFFVGPREFYRRLREMSPDLLAKIQMKAISFTNDLHGDEETKRHARVGARFVNNAMMATLLGDIVSDQLEDGRVVSGVGGQFNFVSQAFALDDARSILTLKATRGLGRRSASNIRWAYGHTTVPRHFRDIVVSEYGVADLRGKSDEQVIATMLAITDSRFQPVLLRRAKRAGKIAADYDIPPEQRSNTPERIAEALRPMRENGLLPDFPLGTDFDATEQRLLKALRALQHSMESPFQLIRLAGRGLSRRQVERAALVRMRLDKPATLSERFYAALLAGALTPP